MTDKDLAQLQLGIYQEVPVTWDYWTGDSAPVVFGAKLAADGVTDIVLRGSAIPIDWLKDFDALADPFQHNGLGPVHPGFLMGMEDIWKLVQANTKAPRRVIGHSLGAARAAVLTGLMVLAGQPPIYRCVWGEPLSTFKQGADIIAKAPAKSYRNGSNKGHDPVTYVPLRFWPEEYQRASALTNICIQPSMPWHGLSPSSLLAWHNMRLYAFGSEG
jgi:hypothetical protein